MNIPNSPFNADVLRMQFTSRALASSGLRPKQWGLVNDTNPCIALKRVDGSMLYAPIEDTNALFKQLKLSGLTGTGIRNLVVDAFGNITVGSLSDNPSKGDHKINVSDDNGGWIETAYTSGVGDIIVAESADGNRTIQYSPISISFAHKRYSGQGGTTYVGDDQTIYGDSGLSNLKAGIARVNNFIHREKDFSSTETAAHDTKWWSNTPIDVQDTTVERDTTLVPFEKLKSFCGLPAQPHAVIGADDTGAELKEFDAHWLEDENGGFLGLETNGSFELNLNLDDLPTPQSDAFHVTFSEGGNKMEAMSITKDGNLVLPQQGYVSGSQFPDNQNVTITAESINKVAKQQGVIGWQGVTGIGQLVPSILPFQISWYYGLQRHKDIPIQMPTPVWSADGTHSIIYFDTVGYGEVKSQGTFLTNAERRTKLPLCVLTSTGGGIITGIIEDVMMLEDPIQSMRDMFQFCRPKKGLSLIGKSTATFGITGGEWYYMGVGANSNNRDPNTYTTSQVATVAFFPVNRAEIEFTTAISSLSTLLTWTNNEAFSNWYDNNGVLTALASNNWQVLRVYGTIENTATTPLMFVQRGQAQYANYTDAFKGVSTESFVVNPTLEKMVCLGVIIIKKSATATNVDTQGMCLTSDTWGQMGGAGGGSGTSSSVVHNDTLGLNDGEYKHLTVTQYTNLQTILTNSGRTRYSSITGITSGNTYGSANVGGLLKRATGAATISLSGTGLNTGDWIDLVVTDTTGTITISNAVSKQRTITFADGVIRVYFDGGAWYFGGDSGSGGGTGKVHTTLRFATAETQALYSPLIIPPTDIAWTDTIGYACPTGCKIVSMGFLVSVYTTNNLSSLTVSARVLPMNSTTPTHWNDGGATTIYSQTLDFPNTSGTPRRLAGQHLKGLNISVPSDSMLYMKITGNGSFQSISGLTGTITIEED